MTTERYEHFSPSERAALGRSARSSVPRSSHGAWTPSAERPSPVGVLEAQAKTRIPELVPLRHQRMLASPFAFYRGGAAIMAADLASTPATGIQVQCCGDAHLANFGGFESPERKMVFDINDFDETLPGPWEWDVKRLAASFAIAAQDREFDEATGRNIVLRVVRAYREAMRSFAGMTNLDVWYAHLDVDGVLARWGESVTGADRKRVDRTVEKARTKNSMKAFAKLTERIDDRVRIKNDPPLIVRLEDLVPGDQVDKVAGMVEGWVHGYRRTLQRDRAHLLESYRVVDIARKVVGVGSVGTRCWIVLLIGREESDPLFLQVKEAEASVLEEFLAPSEYGHPGRRVVEGQRLMQAASDIFLGWDHTTDIEGIERHFYLRQLWDGKLSADLTTMPPTLFPVYGELCGWTLARAHARSGDRIAIGAYLGARDVFDRALADFAFAYAAQNERDYEAVQAAAKDGRLAVSG